MKYLKSYKLFESVESTIFPDKMDIEELFYDLTDHGIVKKCNYIDSGYLLYPQVSIFQRSGLKSSLYSSIRLNPDNWDKLPCDELYGEPYGSLFIDPSTISKKMQDFEESVWFDDVNKANDLAKRNNLPNKPFLQLLLDNIENGKIKGIPFIHFNCGLFETYHKQEVIDCLERIYKATGFRPFREFWSENYVEGDTDNLITMIALNPTFVKVDDKTHSNLIKPENYNHSTINLEITSHFI